MQWRRWLKERWQLLKDETRFSRRQLMVVGGLSVVMLAGGALNARESRLNQVVLDKPKPAVRPAAAKPSKTRKELLVVHVSGAVARPGLYKLKPGSRTADAIDAAGGITVEGNADALNLAALVKDGQKLWLPGRGEPVSGSDDDGLTQDGEQARLNLNTASADQLDELDGIGPVLAKRILDWRRRHGRFTSVSQLDQISGIGPKKLSLIRDRLIVQ